MAGTPPNPDAGTTRVRLVTRPGCHLCDDARDVIAQVCAELGERFDEVDLSADPAYADWAEEIPVTLVDGRRHDYWKVDPDRLRQALRTRGIRRWFRPR